MILRDVLQGFCSASMDWEGDAPESWRARLSILVDLNRGGYAFACHVWGGVHVDGVYVPLTEVREFDSRSEAAAHAVSVWRQAMAMTSSPAKAA